MAANDQYPVPDVSAELYRETLEFAKGTPSWVHTAVEIFTEAGVVVLAVLLALALWRARRYTARTMALALLGPLVTLIAYGISELSKTFIEQLRPCRALAPADPLVTCPPPGDWSFPSNHATIVGAAAIAVLLTWRWLGAVAVLLAALVAYSRVFLGVHYPHDALAGFVLGAVVAAVLMPLLAGPAGKAVARLRRTRALGPLLGSEHTSESESGDRHDVAGSVGRHGRTG